MNKEPAFNYGVSLSSNRRLVEMINTAWGETVAWLEDVKQPSGHTAPVIKSCLVRGALPGRVHVPAFQSAVAPAPRRNRTRPALVAELEAPAHKCRLADYPTPG